jgi:hypothetical protein
MGERSLSLRSQVDKWFHPASLVSIKRTPIHSGRVLRCVRVESRAERIIFFFKHGDGVWRVYPPEPGDSPDWPCYQISM